VNAPFALLLPPFFVALAGALLLTPIVRRAAWTFGIVAKPAADRWNDRPTALLGGIAIFGGVLAGIVALLASGASGAETQRIVDEFGRPGLGILIAATLMFATGLADDRFDFRPATKLAMQGVAAAALISFHVVLPLTGWLAVDVVVTFFWFIAITNAVNLLDNMDGVAAGVSGLSAFFLALAFARQGAWGLSAVCLAVAGSAAGFLPFNFHRASIFMGDSGSLFFGALLAGLGAAYPDTASGSVFSVLAIPALVVVIPILDTSLVTVSRTLAGRPISMGGRDHTTHRLVALGLSQRQTALLLYAFASAAGVAALLLPGRPSGMLVASVMLVTLGVLAAYLMRAHSYPIPAAAATTPGKLTVVVSDLLHKRRALEVLVDLVLFAAAHVGAYMLRYDEAIPATQLAVLELTLAVAVGAKLLGFLMAGVYRGTWQQISIVDLYRLMRGMILGTLFTVAAFVFLFRTAEFARSIFVLDAMLVLLLTAGVRFSFRSLDLLQRASAQRLGVNTLIYGAGRAGDTVLRHIVGGLLTMRPVGFVDDDPLKRGRLIHGLPVMGTGKDLARLLERENIEQLVIAADISAQWLSAIHEIAAAAGVEVLRMEIRFYRLVARVDEESDTRLVRA
jgi:UDP-GlcNAc:undecaprenyl-phosphate/decaprenyl-phosphate GlcNAc-1-phosphate transferase